MSPALGCALALLAAVLPPLVIALLYSDTSRAAVLGTLEFGLRKARALFHPRPALLWIAWARAHPRGFMARAFVSQAVKTGDPEGLLEEGLLLWEGGLGAGAREQALDWFRRAAEGGCVDGMYWMGHALGWGAGAAPGAATDRPAVLAWYRRAAQAGCGPAMAKLGELLRGSADPAEAEEGHRWESRRNAEGLPREPRHSAALGGRGRRAEDCASTRSEALDERLEDLFVRLSKRREFQALVWGVTGLAVLLALFTFIGAPAWVIYTFSTSLAAPGMDRSLILALPLAMSLALFGMAGWLWWEVRTPRTEGRLKRLMERAEGGDPQAAHRLAQAYRTGKEGLPKDGLAARVWLGRAAAGGHVPAMLDFALLLQTGEGGFPDPAAARAWLEQAAAAGSAEAQRRLGGGIAPKN